MICKSTIRQSISALAIVLWAGCDNPTIVLHVTRAAGLSISMTPCPAGTPASDSACTNDSANRSDLFPSGSSALSESVAVSVHDNSTQIRFLCSLSSTSMAASCQEVLIDRKSNVKISLEIDIDTMNPLLKFPDCAKCAMTPIDATQICQLHSFM